jgi:hypothetical protein
MNWNNSLPWQGVKKANAQDLGASLDFNSAVVIMLSLIFSAIKAGCGPDQTESSYHI